MHTHNQMKRFSILFLVGITITGHRPNQCYLNRSTAILANINLVTATSGDPTIIQQHIKAF